MTSRKPPDVARRAWPSFLAALMLWVFFDATKHSPVFAPYAPFGVDPYDAVGSFTFQIAIAVACLNVVRVQLAKRRGTTDWLPYVDRGIAVVASCVAVTMASDSIAILRAGVHPPRSVAEAGVWAAIFGLAIASAALMVGLRTDAVGWSAPAGQGEFDSIFGHAVLRAVDPQRHAVRFAVAVSLSMGILATAAEVLIDGPAPTLTKTVLVIAVRVTIEAVGVIVGLMSLGRYLGVVAFSRGRASLASAPHR